MGYISRSELMSLATKYMKSGYGAYLQKILE
jgi:hypothetical protein